MVWYDRLRIYEVDISDPDAELEFTLCASVEFPFIVVVPQFMGDRLYVVGWVIHSHEPMTFIDCKGLWDYKMNQLVAWVFNPHALSIRVRIPARLPPRYSLCSGIDTFLFLRNSGVMMQCYPLTRWQGQ